jgi:hypothetical protein
MTLREFAEKVLQWSSEQQLGSVLTASYGQEVRDFVIVAAGGHAEPPGVRIIYNPPQEGGEPMTAPNYPYPTWDQCVAEIPGIVASLRAGKIVTPENEHAAYVGVGYGLSIGAPVQKTQTLNKTACAAAANHLEAILADHAANKAITPTALPWGTLIALLLQLLEAFRAGK